MAAVTLHPLEAIAQAMLDALLREVDRDATRKRLRKRRKRTRGVPDVQLLCSRERDRERATTREIAQQVNALSLQLLVIGRRLAEQASNERRTNQEEAR